MLTDWFTIVAQALNFLILVWLMKRFLYKPILHAIDEREKRIAIELANADAKRAEAQKEHDEFQHKNAEFDQQRAALLSKATDQAQAERQRLIDEARKAADALSAKRQETLRNEERNLYQAISRRTQQEVFAIARKALTDLATVSLEERLGEVFTRRLREMDGKAKEALGEALKTVSGPAVVRSAFDVPADQRAAIQNALNETFSAEIRVRFETAPDLIAGIELTSNGQKVAWSIADYLASLERGIDELLKEKDKPEAKAAPKLESKPEVKAEAKPKPEPESKPEVKAEAKPKSEPESKPEAETEAKPKSEPESKPEVKVEAKPKPEPESKPEVKAEAKTKPEPESKPEVKAEAKPKSEPESKPEAETEAKPKSEPESKPEVKAEAKPKPEPESKPEAETEAKPKPEPEEPKPGT
jgi:F-type H+-transporting ATPase subunit b